MDSGSAECVCVAPEDIAKSISSVETEASRQGQTYHTSDAGVIKNNGGKDSDDVFINHETCRKTWFPREHGVYVLHSWVNESPADKRVRRSDEPYLWHEREESAIPRDTWNQRSL